jgi:hypothetical protein
MPAAAQRCAYDAKVSTANSDCAGFAVMAAFSLFAFVTDPELEDGPSLTLTAKSALSSAITAAAPALEFSLREVRSLRKSKDSSLLHAKITKLNRNKRTQRNG